MSRMQEQIECECLMQQASVERKAMNSWMFMRPLKRKELQVTEGEADVLFGRAVQVLQEMMESEHAEHRLQAVDILLRHAKRRDSDCLPHNFA
ncbi:hypothetical protein [Paenibacillus alvei]|uniref:hypothetical protein n=1 Tax=Paenibacillus alvei TaxID=44250 RepID=UPI00227E82A0|nr:hypothetical protein [Paenibacillus alvei]